MILQDKFVGNAYNIKIGVSYVKVYDYEYNNNKHFGYTEKKSRAFITQFAEVIHIPTTKGIVTYGLLYSELKK